MTVVYRQFTRLEKLTISVYYYSIPGATSSRERGGK